MEHLNRGKGMKKHIGVILSGWLIIGLAQAAEFTSSFPTPFWSFEPNIFLAPSKSVLQLQAAEAARQSAHGPDRSIHNYGIIRHLNNIRTGFGLVANEAEREIIARSVITTALLDQNSFSDLVVFYLCSSYQLATRMAYLAISAWAREARKAGTKFESISVDDIVHKYAHAFDHHWLDTRDHLLPLFREQLIKYRDLSMAIYPDVASPIGEGKEQKGDLSEPAPVVASLPAYYQGILGTIEANLERINRHRSIGSHDPFQGPADAILDLSKVTYPSREQKGPEYARWGDRSDRWWSDRRLSYRAVREFYPLCEHYGLSTAQSYDLAGALFLAATSVSSDMNDIYARTLRSLRRKFEKEQQGPQRKRYDVLTLLIDPLYLKAKLIDSYPTLTFLDDLEIFRWRTEKRSFLNYFSPEPDYRELEDDDLNVLDLESEETEHLFADDPVTREKLAYIKGAKERYEKDVREINEQGPMIKAFKDLAAKLPEGKGVPAPQPKTQQQFFDEAQAFVDKQYIVLHPYLVKMTKQQPLLPAEIQAIRKVPFKFQMARIRTNIGMMSGLGKPVDQAAFSKELGRIYPGKQLKRKIEVINKLIDGLPAQ